MSAGRFSLVTYETDSADLGQLFMPIRLQPETLALVIGGATNAAPLDAITLPLRVSVSAGEREYGVKPRKVTIRFTDPTNLPAGYSGDDITLPVPDPAVFAAFTLNAVGTYLGSPVQLISKKAEDFL